MKKIATGAITGHTTRSLCLLPVATLCLALAALLLTGCGGGKKSKANGEQGHPPHASAAAVTASADAFIVPEDGKLTIEATDDMRYSLHEFVVRPGQQVELTLTHLGRMPASAMGHNLVILKKYTNINVFAQSAARSAQTDYIPPAMAGQVLAHTKVLGGGESDTITFTAPADPGAYDFICSFPAHLTAGMHGKMIVSNE